MLAENMILQMNFVFVQQLFDIMTMMDFLDLELESSGLKTLKCQFCDKGFSKNSTLTGLEHTHINVTFVIKDF